MYFSQCGEDVFLNDNYFHNKRDGTYIELGALDGILYSNTKFFQDELGWNGILIEPHEIAFRCLEKNRPNNYLFNNLVSNSTEELKFKHFVNGHVAVSGVENTLSQFHFDEFYNHESNKHFLQDTVILKPTSLTEIIKSTPIKHIDLLSLDVEGHEYEVLQSWDFSVPIHIILIEMLGVNRKKDELCRVLLRNNGYKFDTTFKHNEIYLLQK